MKLTRFAWASLTVAMILLAGCVPSLNALYKASDLVFQEQLLGTWKPPRSDKETWTFTRLPGDDKACLLTIRDDQDQLALLQARLVQVKDKLFLDLYPHEMEVPVGAWYQIHFVRAHTFMAVRAPIGATLDLAVLNSDKLNNMLKDNPELLAHERPHTDGLVLTAKTEALQAFVTAHYDELFTETTSMTRAAAAEAGPPGPATTQP